MYIYILHLFSKDFYANKDNFNVVTNWFSQRFRARYIRIVPLEWNNAICLRAELYGCDNGNVFADSYNIYLPNQF